MKTPIAGWLAAVLLAVAFCGCGKRSLSGRYASESEPGAYGDFTPDGRWTMPHAAGSYSNDANGITLSNSTGDLFGETHGDTLILNATSKAFGEGRAAFGPKKYRRGGSTSPSEREQAHLDQIRTNLRILEGAKAQYALEYKIAPTAIVTAKDLAPYLRRQVMLPSVADEQYVFGTVRDPIQVTRTGTLAGKSFPLTLSSLEQ
jgi:hypothetical protein